MAANDLGIAAIILSCFGGFSLLLWIAGILDANVRHENRTVLSGPQTNWSAPPSGNAKYDDTGENTNKAWRSIGKLSGEIFCADNETGVATNSHDKKPIPYPYGKDSANRWQRLDAIMESDGKILIRVIIHVMFKRSSK